MNDPASQTVDPPGTETAVIKINLGISGKQIMWLLGSIPATIAALGTAGILFLPARDTDLKQTQQQMTVMQKQVETTQQQLTQSLENQEAIRRTVLELTGAVRDLQTIVTQVKDVPPKVIIREATRPAPRATKPAVPR